MGVTLILTDLLGLPGEGRQLERAQEHQKGVERTRRVPPGIGDVVDG